MVSIMGQFKLEPHPHWSPLGESLLYESPSPLDSYGADKKGDRVVQRRKAKIETNLSKLYM